MYPEKGTRTYAIWEFLKKYTLENGGASPTIRDFIYSKVDKITSTSIVDYHLGKLEEMGLIVRHQGPIAQARNTEILGSHFVVPQNILDNRELSDFEQMLWPASVNHFLTSHEAMDPEIIPDTIVATDDANIALIAIALGYGGVVGQSAFDPAEEDEEEYSRFPA